MKKVLFIIMVFTLLLGCGKKKTIDYSKEYKNLENQLVELTKRFIEIDGNEILLPIEEKQTQSISLAMLYNSKVTNEKLIDPDTKKECNEESFVHIKLNNNKITYIPHLTCGNYNSK